MMALIIYLGGALEIFSQFNIGLLTSLVSFVIYVCV